MQKVMLGVVALCVASTLSACSGPYAKSQTQITKCGTADDGSLRVEGRIRNSESSGSATYDITIDVTDPDGTVIGKAKATVKDVKSDSDAPFVATSSDKAAQGAKLSCTAVEIAGRG